MDKLAERVHALERQLAGYYPDLQQLGIRERNQPMLPFEDRVALSGRKVWGGTLKTVTLGGREVTTWRIGLDQAAYLIFTGVPRDISRYKTLRFWIKGELPISSFFCVQLSNPDVRQRLWRRVTPGDTLRPLEFRLSELRRTEKFNPSRVLMVSFLGIGCLGQKVELAGVELDILPPGARKLTLPKPPKAKPRDDTRSVAKQVQAPRPILLRTASGAVYGTLTKVDGDQLTLDTDRGRRTLSFGELSPYSVWRVRSFLAGADGKRHLALAGYCEKSELWQQARWEYAAAAALDPSLSIPDLDPLRVKFVRAFLGNDEVELKANTIRAQVKKLEKVKILARRKQEFERVEALKKRKVYGVRTVVDRGDTAKRLDVVIISDGFAQKDQEMFDRLAKGLVAGILKVEPFKNYPSYINFHQINIVEPTSGLTGSTAVGSKVNNNILTCNRRLAWALARLAPDADLVCVLANVAGGRATGGGGVLTLNNSGRINAVAIHEIGHALAGLSDEYVDPGVAGGFPDFGKDREWRYYNVTRESNPLLVKWHYWNAPGPAHIPARKVGCYEGGYYRAKGYFRPAAICRMKSSASPYCVVCFEQAEKSLYRFVSPIDRASPIRVRQKMFIGEKLRLLADAVVAEGEGAKLGRLTAYWYLDGKKSRSGGKNRRTWYDASSQELTPGKHDIALRVEFLNMRVRRDHGLLSSQRAWSVEVYDLRRPKASWEGEIGSGLRGEFSYKERWFKAQFKSVVFEAPPGAMVSPFALSSSWTRNPEVTGLFGVRIGLLSPDGLLVVDNQRLIEAAPRNEQVFLQLPELLYAQEGQVFYHRIQAMDLRAQGLHFTARGLPEGCHIEPFTGELYWNVSYLQSGKYRNIKITVSNGRRTVSKITTLVVQNTRITPSTRLRGSDIVLGLRSFNNRVLRSAIRQLRAQRPTFRLLELARLLRARDKAIASNAISQLETLLDNDSTGQLREILLLDLNPHLWHFTDQPPTLSFVEKQVQKILDDPRRRSKSIGRQAKRLKAELRAIRAYNARRGFSG